jgi:hypothetical protein
MAENPLKKDLNRANQIKSEKGNIKKSVTLFDIDYAMMSYLEDVALPTLEDGNGQTLKIPVIYGNSERWKGARRDGVYRDIKGKIQLPIMMLRRTSIAKNDSMPMFNRHVSYRAYSKYNKNNRYDKFSILGNQKPSYEVYNVTMPDYIEVTYECMAWTNYIEHLNTVIESLSFASDEYWGDKTKFKFLTTISDYNVVNEVGENTERINRVEFSLTVKAYLLPEKFDGEETTKKSFSTKRVIVSTETDVTGNGRLEGILTTPSPYYDNKDLIDFLSLNNNKSEHPDYTTLTSPDYQQTNRKTFTGIKLIKAPAALASVITGGITVADNAYDVKVYINGVRYYQTTHFTVSISSSSLTINFNSTNLGFNVTSGDEIVITGKFIDV